MKVSGPGPPHLDDQRWAASGYVPGVGDPAWNYYIAAGRESVALVIEDDRPVAADDHDELVVGVPMRLER